MISFDSLGAKFFYFYTFCHETIKPEAKRIPDKRTSKHKRCVHTNVLRRIKEVSLCRYVVEKTKFR